MAGPLRVLDLFSGIGGFSLGLERAGMKTVAFCEIDPFCRRVLAKHWPDVPCHEDITKLRAGHLDPPIDVICGGFPCTDLSVAGKRSGANGAQSGLWRELVRLSYVAPWTIIENVGHTWRQWVPMLRSELASIGRASLPLSVRAGAIGAVHNRHRIMLVAHPDSERLRQLKGWWCGQGRQVAQELAGSWDWAPRGLGADDGLPNRLERCRALGNTVVPQIPELTGRAILEVEGRA